MIYKAKWAHYTSVPIPSPGDKVTCNGDIFRVIVAVKQRDMQFHTFADLVVEVILPINRDYLSLYESYNFYVEPIAGYIIQDRWLDLSEGRIYPEKEAIQLLSSLKKIAPKARLIAVPLQEFVI